MWTSVKQRLFGPDTPPKATVCTSIACEELVTLIELRKRLHKPHRFYHKFERFVYNVNDTDPTEEFVTEQIAIQATKEANDITGVALTCNRDNHVPPYYEVKGIIYDKDPPTIP